MKETGRSYKQRIAFIDSQLDNILPKVKKASKIGQPQKTLASAFA